MKQFDEREMKINWLKSNKNFKHKSIEKQRKTKNTTRKIERKRKMEKSVHKWIQKMGYKTVTPTLGYAENPRKFRTASVR